METILYIIIYVVHGVPSLHTLKMLEKFPVFLYLQLAIPMTL